MISVRVQTGWFMWGYTTQVLPQKWNSNNKALVPVYILFIGHLVPTQLMQSYASCLLPSLLRCCSCLLFLCRSPQVYSYVTVSACPLFWAFAASFIWCIFCSACWDSMSVLCMLGSVSGFPDLWLVSIAYWDSMPGLWLDDCMLW